MLLLLHLLPIASLVSSVSIPTCAAPSPHNNGLSYTNEECTELGSWGPDQYVLTDCYDAVQQLNAREVYKYSVQEWEFLAPGSRPEFKPLSQTMQTPRRYTYRRSLAFSFPFLLFPGICARLEGGIYYARKGRLSILAQEAVRSPS